MAKVPAPKAADSAEKAYAAAAEAVDVKPVEADTVAAPAGDDIAVQFPPKAKRNSKPSAAETSVVSEPEPVAPEPTAIAPAAPEPVVLAAEPVIEPTPAAAPKAKRALPVPPKAKPLKLAAPKPAAKPVPTPKLVTARKPAPVPPKTISPKTVPLAAPKTAPVKTSVISQLKDTTMATASDFIADVKTKAKAAFDKGTSSIGDATDFAKGNVEAVVESGKIYAAGLQELGSSYVAESKAAFETLTADAKQLATQKTPVDFFKLQSELAKKNFESAVAFGSKSSEAWLKLATETFAPLSGRVNLAVEKIKPAA